MTFAFHMPGRVGNTVRFTATSYQAYTIPVGCVALQILCIGGGGAGGNGFTRAAAAAGGGGGGGGSGAITRAYIPTFFLPPRLYVRCGLVNVLSAVAIAPNENFESIVVGARWGGTGGNGTGAAVGAAGAAGTINALGNGGVYSQFGQYADIAGQAGSAGGAIAGGAGVAVSFGAARVFLSGGAGGGGTTSADFAGGAITVGNPPGVTIPGGAAGSNRGNDGFSLLRPMTFSGGSGGGSSNTGVGGAGGNGAPGCGGGGGGAGTTGGLGGAGGNGLVFITEVY